MKYLFLLLIFITHIGLAMTPERARNVILNDTDAQFAFEFARDKRNKQSTNEQIVDNVLIPIAYHESKLNAKQLQKVAEFDYNKHGQGLYQFEKPSIRSALRRAFRLILDSKKIPFTTDSDTLKQAKVPNYMIQMYQKLDQGKQVDFTQLSPGQQSAIAVFNFLGHPTANIDNVSLGDQKIHSFWYNNHWSGAKKSNRQTQLDRKNIFTRDYNELMSNKKERTLVTGDELINNLSNRVRNIKRPPIKGNPGGLL